MDGFVALLYVQKNSYGYKVEPYKTTGLIHFYLCQDSVLDILDSLFDPQPAIYNHIYHSKFLRYSFNGEALCVLSGVCLRWL